MVTPSRSSSGLFRRMIRCNFQTFTNYSVTTVKNFRKTHNLMVPETVPKSSLPMRLCLTDFLVRVVVVSTFRTLFWLRVSHD
jgi:hypothetical protein